MTHSESIEKRQCRFVIVQSTRRLDPCLPSCTEMDIKFIGLGQESKILLRNIIIISCLFQLQCIGKQLKLFIFRSFGNFECLKKKYA